MALKPTMCSKLSSSSGKVAKPGLKGLITKNTLAWRWAARSFMRPRGLSPGSPPPISQTTEASGFSTVPQAAAGRPGISPLATRTSGIITLTPSFSICSFSFLTRKNGLTISRSIRLTRLKWPDFQAARLREISVFPAPAPPIKKVTGAVAANISGFIK